MDPIIQIKFHRHLFMERTELPPMPGPLVYVVAGNGVFLWGKRDGLEALAPVAECEVRGLFPVVPFVRLEGARVSVALVAEMLREAGAACNTAHEPVESLFYLNFTDEERLSWQVTMPEQIQSPVSVHPVVSALDQEAYANALMEVHTHPRMRAFYSGTDNRDEQGFRLYGVLGLPSPGEEGQKCLPEIRMRVSVFGAYYEFPASWVLELPEGLVEYHSHALSEQQGEEGGCER